MQSKATLSRMPVERVQVVSEKMGGDEGEGIGERKETCQRVVTVFTMV